MNYRILPILFIVLSLLISCDCYQKAAGTVLDNETGKPVEGVTVSNKAKEWTKTITDSAGHFELSSVSGGSPCPPMTVVLEAKEYNTTEISIPAGEQKTVRMQRKK